MTDIPNVVPAEPREKIWQRNLPASAAFDWLRAGMRDFLAGMHQGLAYGLLVYVVMAGSVWLLFATGKDYILLPVLAGFMVVGPIFAMGLYEKSRRLSTGARVTFADMIFVRPAAGYQVVFTGALLCLLMVVWLRAAVIVYALFFGLLPFPGLGNIVTMLFLTPIGWAMLVVGSAIGGLFASFSFAIGAISLPMLLQERSDALTAMGTSMALVWNNLNVMLIWAGIVLALFVLSVATGFIGLIVIFPVLGHGTWHCYRALRPSA
ncbi:MULTISPECIES: DUF2189 domain-containing protein [unclassified Sinorhizobium]|uniref:DUF2189 domain-containing protein n=1 Tax=unclassified Sinorhizobium TaxID=2613772 RepID=UPI0024C3D7E4|nr:MULTISPECIES: DUF2189 domain-containing protein [unclassified Sinorhizobium]MDK1378684.1 DUF2189 domain-containing protein [Sinorhizobium sp. 6-70]MDK1480752.1 DUF2189 domain-containing protein [Sinorhizobium sp. 6-117]